MQFPNPILQPRNPIPSTIQEELRDSALALYRVMLEAWGKCSVATNRWT